MLNRPLLPLISTAFMLCNAVQAQAPKANATKSSKTKECLTEVAKELRRHYFPPPGTERNLVEVDFTMKCDGTVSDINIKKFPLREGHRVAFADKSLTVAVKNSRIKVSKIEVLPCPTQLEATFDGRKPNSPLTCVVKSRQLDESSEIVERDDK